MVAASMLSAATGSGALPVAHQARPCRFPPPYPAAEVRSRACLASGERELQLLVLPVDERQEVLRGPYCGGDEGDVEYSGRYRLVGLRDGQVFAELPLAGEYVFNPERPAYGLHGIPPAVDGTTLVALHQYAGCNNKRVELYRVASSTAMEQLVFVDLEGIERRSEHLGVGDDLTWSAPGEMTFCRYDNTVGRDRCNVYRFDGERMIGIRQR